MLALRKKIIFCCVVSLLLLGAVFCIRFQASRSAFRKVQEEAKQHAQEHDIRKTGKATQHAQEERHLVTKRVWLSDKFPRLELEMKGVQSKIALISSKKDAQCKETLTDVQGVVQEELFYMDEKGTEYTLLANGKVKAKGGSSVEEVSPATLIPMQRFRYFEADHAVYDYRHNTLIAYGVNFWTYATTGHDLVHEYDALFPETTGVASSMTLCHSGSVGSVQFSAENLKMQLGER